MAKISISNLNGAGTELFIDSESFLQDLSNDELKVQGGEDMSYFTSSQACQFLVRSYIPIRLH
ncbi:MAG: hypothetical protein MUD14_00275 [Hydrococcus sp. Prado102]|jgi:hypothetical protein|nr:hypothetical protein [Hydrococcus sp. Prado102]